MGRVVGVNEQELHKELTRLRARRMAEGRIREEDAEREWQDPPLMTGAYLANCAAEEYDYLIDKLWVRGHTCLVIGQYKKGKTTLLQNICRSLATGEKLFGRYDTDKVEGNIVYMDLELTTNDLTLWVSKGGLGLPNVLFAPLRSGNHHLDFRTSFTRKKMREWLEPVMPVSVLAIDPVGAIAQRVSQGDQGENDNTFVGEWLRSFNRFLGEANIESGIVSHHTGQVRGSRRARGAAAWMDVPDVIWSYTSLRDYAASENMHADAESDARLLSVVGRGPEVPEFIVRFDEAERKLYYDNSLADWETEETQDEKLQHDIAEKLRRK